MCRSTGAGRMCNGAHPYTQLRNLSFLHHLSCCTVGSGYSLLLSNGAAITFMPAFSLYTSMGTLVVCLMLVFPYFNYLLAFLDPEDLILELVHDVLEELEEYIKIHTEDDDDDDDDNDDDDANEDDEGWDWDPVEPQILVSETLSLISDLGLSATKKVDKHNANNALQAVSDC